MLTLSFMGVIPNERLIKKIKGRTNIYLFARSHLKSLVNAIPVDPWIIGLYFWASGSVFITISGGRRDQILATNDSSS